jgi:hypothetical protein
MISFEKRGRATQLRGKSIKAPKSKCNITSSQKLNYLKLGRNLKRRLDVSSFFDRRRNVN